MTGKDALARYEHKRDFGKTAEPHGERRARSGEPPVFVIQIHDARAMHFDFRLEVEGVLKSWALPKGPPASPRDKRLAVATEDHPFEYRTFEGVIPPGEYGGGTVIVWDEGAYRNLTTDRAGNPVPMARALEQGHASFRLNGRKLHGDYALTRIRTPDQEGRENWLLVRHAHDHAAVGRIPDPHRARSVHTGRTLRQTAATSAG